MAATGNTAIDAVSDTVSNTAQDYGFGSFESTATVTAGTPFTAGSTDNAPGGVAVLEVKPAGTITTDGSSPPVVSSVGAGTGTTNATTEAFSPPPGTLILALVSAGGTPFGQVVMTTTDTYGLTWTEAVKGNAAGNGYTGIWYAFAPPALACPAAALPGGNIGFPYSGSIATSGGYAPYTYTLNTGSLPSGLTLQPDGTVSGIPAASGTFSFTVTVTDSFGNTVTSGSQTVTVAGNAPATPFVVASWTTPGSKYEYGTTNVPVANREHDWLIVVASWTTTQDGAVSFVCDNARNVYRPLNPSVAGFDRVQVWVCPNARAAKQVYVSQSAFVRNLDVTVLAVRNMEAGYIVDGQAIPVNGSSASGWTMSVTTTRPCLLIAAGVSGAALTTLPGFWNPATSQSGAGGASQVVGWQDQASAGTFNAAFGMTLPQFPTSGYAGVMFALATTGAGPIVSGPNPAWPNITLRAAFGYQPGNPVNIQGWTDITSRFLGLSGDRGRSFELDELVAADLEIEIDNFDGALTYGNNLSPYFPNVTLVVPVQLLADWQGRRYCIASGLITALPETYEFERSIVKAAISDDYSKLPQILLPSAMICEQLYDQPLHLWPLNDGSTAGQASNWSGRSTSILVPVKGKFGGGSTSGTPNTGFGNTGAGNFPSGVAGTTDTCWGNSQITGTAEGTTFYSGTALVNRNDPTLPLTATGATYEVWARINFTANNELSGATIMTLSDEKGVNGSGEFFSLAVGFHSGFTYLLLPQRGVSWGNWQIIPLPGGSGLFDNGWHHYALTISTGGHVAIYLDGIWMGAFQGIFPNGTPSHLSFGADYSMDPFATAKLGSGVIGVGGNTWIMGCGFFTGYLQGAAVYDRVLDPERIASHFLSGSTGFVGELSGVRIQRVLTYANWAGPQAIENGLSQQQIFNYLGGGYASSGLGGAIGQQNTAGGGFTDNGAQADVTIQDIAAGECGFLYVAADGTLTFRERDTQFNQATADIIGDDDNALNAQQMFNSGVGLWNHAATGCTVGTSAAWSYAGGSSCLITVTGTPPQAFTRNEMVPAQFAGASMWVMSPQGCNATIAIDYFNGSGGNLGTIGEPTTFCPPMTPVRLSLPPTVPITGAVTMHFGPTISGSPATGTQLMFDRPRISPGGLMASYEGDVEIATDIQYLYNDVVVTRNIDQATYRARSQPSRTQFFPRIYQRTIYTGEGDPQAVVDCAQFLLDAYAQPKPRVTRVTVNAAANPELWPFVLGTDIGDVVAFQRNPVQGGAIAGVFMVISIEYNLTKDAGTFTYVLAPTTGQSILTLDDPVYGLVGAQNELGW